MVLAMPARRYEPEPEHTLALVGTGVDMDNLYREGFAVLLAKTRASATPPRG
jgi:hypothetical protein